ncbi:MAG: putative rane protein [Actinomycetota bacterium]|nr:putative rane protein [Actinomycetota bacterium]
MIRALLLTAMISALPVVGPAEPPSAHALGVHPALGAPPALGAGTQTAVTPDAQLSEADKDLLIKVRLAGLWETPAGDMAARKGVSPRVRQIGKMIATQHVELDALVVKAAKDVGLPLPNTPNADQQKWLGEMNAASGEAFDKVFVDRLRAAHGKVFPAIANVRAGTRNEVVRKLAGRANGFVLTHLTLLESTGKVDFNGLPLPPQPSPAPAQDGASAGQAADPGNVADADASSQAPPVGLAATNTSAGITGFFSNPMYAGIVLPVALLLFLPRLLRAAVRRRLAGRVATDSQPLPVSVRGYSPGRRETPGRYERPGRYDRPVAAERPARDARAPRDVRPVGNIRPVRDDPAGRYDDPEVRRPSPYAELSDDPGPPRR